MKPAAIIDLDNCISNDQWRLPRIQHHHLLPNDRYWDYHDCCDQDLHENQHVIERLRRQYRLLVFTSRPEVVRRKTELWLRKWSIPCEMIFMRPNYNQMTSVELKKLMLSCVPDQYQIEHAIDDRHDILDMYRSQGIPSTQRVFIYEPEVIHP